MSMFLEREDLESAIQEYQLDAITTSERNINQGIMAAVSEAQSYLHSKYDCAAIFSARGDKRHATLLEHCVNIAVWYICRRGNTDLIFEQVSEYRKAAIDWLEKVAGTKGTEKPLAPDLPLLIAEDGNVRIKTRIGSRPKFRHSFD